MTLLERLSLLMDSRRVNLLYELTQTQFRLKSQNSFFGVLWSVANPLLMVAVFYVFFAERFGSEVDHYGIYLLVGVVQYAHYSGATSRSMKSLVQMRQLTKESAFPKELIVFSSVLAGTIDFVIAIAVCVGVAYATGIEPSAYHWWLMPIVVLQYLFVTWVSLVLATVFPLARDIDHIYQVFLRALMFVTPIFYKAKSVSGLAYYVVALNPLAQLLALSRGVLLADTVPSPATLAAAFVVNAGLVRLALVLFRSSERRFAEYV